MSRNNLGAVTVKADLGHGVANVLAVELRGNAKYTVYARVVWTQVEEHEVRAVGTKLHAQMGGTEKHRFLLGIDLDPHLGIAAERQQVIDRAEIGIRLTVAMRAAALVDRAQVVAHAVRLIDTVLQMVLAEVRVSFDRIWRALPRRLSC